MRYPQLLVFAPDDWLAGQLRPLAEERRWLLKAGRLPQTILEAVRDSRPTVLFVQADPTGASHEAIRLVADVHTARPDVAIVLAGDHKLPEADQAGWAALGYDLGARFVLFPPITRPVLEDLASGLMTATLRRVLGPTKAEAFARAPAEVIDLADGAYEAP
jgi:hypothetical protein